MGKNRRTFSVDFKMKAIEMYLHRGTYSVIGRWIKFREFLFFYAF